MKYFLKIILFILLFSPSYAQQLEKVSLQLQWLDQFQFAGYYMAKEKGFYNQAGLDVTIKKFQKNTDVAKDVSLGKSTYGVGLTSLMIHKSNGLPLTILAAIFQHSPAALITTNPKIISVNNLINKKIMISSDAIISASYISMLFSEGILKDNIIVQPHSYNINDLIDGKTDAIAGYISNEPFYLQQQGVEYQAFHPKDYGYDFYGDLLFTSQKELQQHPKRVEAFTKATLKGWAYAFEHIEETAQLLFDKYNIQNKSLEALVYEANSLKKLAYSAKGEIGHLNYTRFEEIARTYKLLGLLPNKFTLNDLLYDVYSLMNIQLTPQEQEWLMHHRQIRLATNKDWMPIEFFDEDNEYSGIAAGYLKLLEQKLNVQFHLNKESYWHEMIDKIKNSQLDMFMAVVKTPQREDFMHFTSAYLEFPTVIVTQDSVGYIKNLEELSYKVIAVEDNYYTQELIEQINPDIILKKVNTTTQALELVYSNEAFAYIGALPVIGHYIKDLHYTNLKINGEAPFKTALSFGVNKELDILHTILQKTLNSITKEEHDAIYNKWINTTYEYQTDRRTIYAIIILSLIVLIAFLIRNRYLKKELLLKEQFFSKLKELNAKLEKKNLELKTLSEIDTLTQISNRRKCEHTLNKEIARSIRNKLPLCVVMLDIDHFKVINDTYGHKVGDIVLHEIAQSFKDNIRIYDFIARWGGEEFLLICPNSTLEQTFQLCQKLQKILFSLHFEAMPNHKVTVSCGIAQYDFKQNIEELVKEADDQMYQAKISGRNRVFPTI